MKTLRIAAFVLLAAGCSSDPSTPPARNEIPAGQDVVLTPVEGYSPHYGGFDLPARVVVKSDTAWARIAARLFDEGAPRPSIDFSREIVLVTAMGSRPTGGFSIRVQRAVTADGGVVAEVVETSPGRSCATTQALTSPVHAVRIPRPNGSVSFVERQFVREC